METRTWWAGGATMLLVLGLTSTAWGAPRWLRVSWTAVDTAHTTMTVDWNDSDAGGGTLEWRQSGSTATDSMDVSAVDTGDGGLGYVYEATITGLLPYTVYEYRVFSGGSWSDWKMFRTAPEIGSCQPFRLVAGGDGRGGEAFWDPGYVSRHWDNIAEQILTELPVAMLYSGDLVHEGEAEQWVDWFEMSEPLTSYVPVLPAIGNHDDGPGDGDGQWYNKMFALPRGGAGALDATVDPDGDGVEDMWAVVVGNTLLVTLNTEGIDVDVQHAFLDDVLTTWRPQVDWIFLQFHRPLWSSGIGHGSNEDDTLRAADLIAYIDDTPVDFVIGGHDHDYERFHPMWGGYGGRPHVITPLPGSGGDEGIPNGVIHIVTGGAGSFTNLVMTCREDGCHRCSGNLHYMVFDISPMRVDAVVRDMGPILTLSDASLRPDPIDTFSVMHTSSVCGVVTPDEEPEVIPEPVPDTSTDTVADPVEDPTVDTSVPDVPEDTGADPAVDMAVDVPEDTAEDTGDDDSRHTAACGCSLVH